MFPTWAYYLPIPDLLARPIVPGTGPVSHGVGLECIQREVGYLHTAHSGHRCISGLCSCFPLYFTVSLTIINLPSHPLLLPSPLSH